MVGFKIKFPSIPQKIRERRIIAPVFLVFLKNKNKIPIKIYKNPKSPRWVKNLKK